MADVERRQRSRERVGWNGQCRFGTGPWIECRLVDVTVAGAAVELHGPAPESGPVTVRVDRGEGPRLVVHGEVRHRRGDQDAVVVGIEFAGLTAAKRAQLAEFIAQSTYARH